eukprot:PITA_16332
MGKKEQSALCDSVPKTEKASLIKQFNELEKLRHIVEGLVQANNNPSGLTIGGPHSFSQHQVSVSHLQNLWDVKGRGNLDASIGRFFFANGISFNVCRSPYWKEMVRDLVNNAPKGYKPPSYEKMRTSVLSEERAWVEARLQDIKDSWKESGVSIVSDGWTDVNHHPLINILVSSPKGVLFLKSYDTTGKTKDGPYLTGLLREAIEEVGRENVVQIVTDSASNNILAGGLIEDEYPTIFWTPCSVHCLNLLLKDINNIAWVDKTITEAKMLQHFIINHAASIAIYRKYAKLQLLRCAETRFASAFVMLQRLIKMHQSLREMVVSMDWQRWKGSHTGDGLKVEDIIICLSSENFWRRVEDIVTLITPIVSTLRIFDSDQPCLGDVFESMDQMREKIHDIMEDENSRIDKDTRNEVWELSLTRWKMLHSPLHSIAFLLNPKWFHKKPSSDVEVMQNWNTFISRCYDRQDRTALRFELGKYLRSEDHSANEDCAYNRQQLGPVDFWIQYGTGTPLLHRLAIHLLSQVTSSSASERNWSEYAFIHSMKRNRLDTKMAQDLVFVHSNLRLLSQQQLEYKTGPTRMWDYGGSQDDENNELPLEVLQDNAEDMLDDTMKSIDQNNSFGIGSSSTTILENELQNLDY